MQGDAIPPNPIQKWSKRIVALLLIAMLFFGVWLLFHTTRGTNIRHDPEGSIRGAHTQIHRFVHRHPIAAPLVYLTVYVSCAVLVLPVWWLQFLAGIAFGLYEGTLLSVVGSTMGVTIAVIFIRWLAADWFHQRVENHVQRLKQLDETLGHNGFLFVMTARLIPLIPFGLFNYVLGLSQISYRDIILGTFLGAIPLAAIHVALGAGYNPHDWNFNIAITSVTLLLLAPLMLRYLRPQWFKKIGVE